MTTRLYYTDAGIRDFDAQVVACEPADGRHLVRLDRTAFYPASGGQPFDAGTLDGVPVIDVFDDDEGGVVHATAGPIPVGRRVRGTIDWARRADHMQQHTGQHVLSAAFERGCGVRTTSFHMGTDVSSIDLAREVSDREVAGAEDAANAVVWEDRPVTVRFVDAAEAARLALRKPTDRTGEIRLVEVEGFDLSACGGTHVPRTGVIGVIAIAGWERCKGGTRVFFVCGRRALLAHRRLRDIVEAAGRVLSVGGGDLVTHIERLRQDLRRAAKARTALDGELAAFRAAAWRAEAEAIGPHRVVIRVDAEADATALKGMAQALIASPGLIVCLVGGGAPAPVVLARSADVDFDASELLRAVAAEFGGRGGGRADLAQGGVTAAPDRIVAFLRQRLQA
jgi:alanyl-tRNA synthetase